MQKSDTITVQKALKSTSLHSEWASNYRTGENKRFYRLALDRILDEVALKPGATVLDAGCGTGVKAALLAERNFNVLAADYSRSALEQAQRELSGSDGLANITFREENLLDLKLDDESVDMVLVWGVLMHIPEIEKALSELKRVTRKGGVIVIAENNAASAPLAARRFLKRMRGKGGAERRTDRGEEYWIDLPDGRLFVRQMNIQWLLAWGAKNGLSLRARFAGQLSELYTKFKNVRLVQMAHQMNRFYFRAIGWPALAMGNIVIFEK